MKVEIRSENEVEISGYVNAVERQSKVLPKNKSSSAPGNFVEVIKAGSFSKSLNKNPDVLLKLNHQKIIGSTTTNLELKEDEIGLYAKAIVTDSETVKAARDGKIRGWSFGMINPKSNWGITESDTIYSRDIFELELTEVSILTVTPAYPACSVEVRSNETSVEINEVNDELVDDYNVKIGLLSREIEILKMKG